MAKCVNYLTGEDCPYFLKCSKEGTTIPLLNGREKQLKQYTLYCLKTPGVKKIAAIHEYTGRTPKWCPLGRDGG